MFLFRSTTYSKHRNENILCDQNFIISISGVRYVQWSCEYHVLLEMFRTDVLHLLSSVLVKLIGVSFQIQKYYSSYCYCVQ